MSKRSKNYVLGLDIGTSGTKALLCTEEGKIVAEASSAYAVSSPKPSWNEQDPKLWWVGTQKSVHQLLKSSGVKAKSILAIGLSGQMHGSVFLDKTGTPLRPALLWNDQRTSAQCATLTRLAGGQRALISMVNNPALTGYTAPKILWLKQHEPHHYKKIAQILLPKDYIRYQLSNTYATDAADASGTLLLDIRKRDWHKTLLQKLDIPQSWLPPVFESPDVVSQLSKKAAKALKLLPGTPIVAGAGDQAAAAVGMGIVHSGLVSATTGTSGVIFAASEKMVPNTKGLLQSFCHAVPNKWAVFGCMLSAGGALDWACHTLYSQKENNFDALLARAEQVPPGSEGLIFLPYLEGERCPHPDPNLRGGWIGLNRQHGRNHMIRATLEGISFGMGDQIELLRSLGLPIKEVRCAGGGAKSPFWRQIQANVYNAKTVCADTPNASAYGAALLAAVGIGIWNSVETACKKCVHTQHPLPPQKKWTPLYKKRHQIYQKLYPALKNSFKALSTEH